jgi:hypothetical protein
MSRVINSDSPGQIRNRLLKLVWTTTTEINQSKFSEIELNDAIAFVILSLAEIERTISLTTAPWEKREYWVKADQFRGEWNWVGEAKTRLIQSRTEKGWLSVPPEIEALVAKLKEHEPSRRSQRKAFWKGAYSIFVAKK